MSDHIGRRVARWRDLAGMTQQELADRVGRTQAWVSMVENGRHTVLRRDVLISLARALKVDVQQLIAQPSIRTRDELTMRRTVPALRAALYGPDEVPEPRTAEAVAADLDRFMASRMACDYPVITELAAPLVAETSALVNSGGDGRRTRQLACRVLVTASLAVKPMGYVDLALALAERATAYAGELDSPVESAAARYALSQAVLAAGSRRRSLELASQAAAAVQGGDDPGAVTWYGMLHLQCALASASLGQPADVHLAEAKDAAGRRPTDPWLMEFTAANVATWESAMALERGDYGAVPGIVNRVDRGGLRTHQRRVAMLMNAGRAWYAVGDHTRAIRSILEADDIAPGEVRSRPTIREITGAMIRDAHRGTELTALAARVGVDPLSET